MNDPLRRSLRGLFQLGVAETLVQVVEAFFVHLNEAQHIALLGLLNLAVTFGQNWLEDNTQSFPAVLKAPPSPGVNPVPDEAGFTLVEVVLVVLAVCVVAMTWHVLGVDLTTN